MQSGAIRKWLLALTLLAVILWTTVHFYNLILQNSGNGTRVILEPQSDFAYRGPKTSASKTNNPTRTDAAAQQRLRQKVEEWLALNHHSAASLLAAFHVLDDTNYLREAAAHFPDNPQVEWTVLARNVFPANRRRWLDRFKASSPSNSLANYLSAQAYFQNGRSAAAVRDLVAATGKPDFGNYTLESQLDAEELGLFLGKSSLDAAETAHASSASDTKSELATLKQLASQMTDLQQQELNVGDTDSAENLAQMGTLLGVQLNSGASGQYLANQLAGIAVETMIIQQLNQNTSYDFLDGETPGQRLQELGQQRAALDQLDSAFKALLPGLPDAVRVSFLERTSIYGEIPAMHWLLQRYGNSPNGQ